MAKGKLGKPIKTIKNKLPYLFLLLLLVAFSTYFFRQEVYREKSVLDKKAGEVLALQRGDVNGDGTIERIQLELLFKNQGIDIKNNAKLTVSKNGKEVASKDVALQYNEGRIEIIRLFNNEKRQIFFTTGVGAHSTTAYIYQLDDNRLQPICPEDDERGDIEKEREADCLFFTDGTIYPDDLDNDYIFEIVSLGHVYPDGQVVNEFYKWNRTRYVKVLGEEHKRFLNLAKRAKTEPAVVYKTIEKVVEKECPSITSSPITPNSCQQQNNEIGKLKDELRKKDEEIKKLKNEVSWLEADRFSWQMRATYCQNTYQPRL